MSADIHAQKILILDFGSQYTQLIARRVREVGVYSEIRAFDMTEQEIREYNPRGVILSGSPESVAANASPRAPACAGILPRRAEVGGTRCREERRTGRRPERLGSQLQSHR